MDNWRLLLAIGLSFLIFLIWSITFGPQPKTPTQTTDRELAQKPPVTASPSPAPQEPLTPPANREAPAGAQDQTAEVSRPTREITVNTNLYQMTLSEKGAAVIGMALLNYQESVAPDAPHKELIPKELQGGTVLLSMNTVTGRQLAQGLYTAETPSDILSVQDAPQQLRFTYLTSDQIRITKTYRFFPDSYLVGLEVAIANGSGEAIAGDLAIGLRDLDQGGNNAYGFQGPSGLINNDLEQVKIKKIAERNRIDGNIRWIAIERLYFMDSLISQTPVQGSMALRHEGDVIENSLVLPIKGLPAGGQETYEFSLFMGPKSISVLNSLDHELDRAIDFGMVDFIARPCLYFMNFIYKYIPNYGIAIIILTILTRIIFWPLAAKSYKSMNDMRKLQPLMQELRTKYKDDKVKLNQETMALYRTYKINPLGGCLPMLIQLPVFFALYRMLYQAIELRHAPFFGWINDLSAPDRLFPFFTDKPIPLLDFVMKQPYGIPVLTIIMGATMILQQKMSPPAGDPTQAKMMMFMPIIFTFLFLSFPSGLVLYWLVGNLVSIAQQYFTQRKAA